MFKTQSNQCIINIIRLNVHSDADFMIKWSLPDTDTIKPLGYSCDIQAVILEYLLRKCIKMRDVEIWLMIQFEGQGLRFYLEESATGWGGSAATSIQGSKMLQWR